VIWTSYVAVLWLAVTALWFADLRNAVPLLAVWLMLPAGQMFHMRRWAGILVKNIGPVTDVN
jgi:hypothetical protein